MSLKQSLSSADIRHYNKHKVSNYCLLTMMDQKQQQMERPINYNLLHLTSCFVLYTTLHWVIQNWVSYYVFSRFSIQSSSPGLAYLITGNRSVFFPLVRKKNIFFFFDRITKKRRLIKYHFMVLQMFANSELRFCQFFGFCLKNG